MSFLQPRHQCQSIEGKALTLTSGVAVSFLIHNQTLAGMGVAAFTPATSIIHSLG